MKMVKHCHEESVSNMDLAQGALLGLVVDKRLEITNCFPFPKSSDETMDEEEYQLAMMRRLRRVNVDHFHVGWYQSADVGNFLSMPLLESQFHYQTSIEESVVVIYDTAKSARGFLTLKAYRLTPQAIQMYKDGEYTPEALRLLKISYESLFIEVPIVIKNSALTNIMMSELNEMVPEEDGTHFLDLGTASVLENHLRSLMERVDELNQEATKYNKHQQMVIRQDIVSLHLWRATAVLFPQAFYSNQIFLLFNVFTGKESYAGQASSREQRSRTKGRADRARGGGDQAVPSAAGSATSQLDDCVWPSQHLRPTYFAVLFAVAG